MKEQELKTLKDFKHFIDNGPMGYSEDFVYHSELKAEAIKWIKEDLRCMKELEEGYLWNCADTRIDFIKDFFNITDEDLK